MDCGAPGQTGYSPKIKELHLQASRLCCSRALALMSRSGASDEGMGLKAELAAIGAGVICGYEKLGLCTAIHTSASMQDVKASVPSLDFSAPERPSGLPGRAAITNKRRSQVMMEPA
jgi:hypothetical protein